MAAEEHEWTRSDYTPLQLAFVEAYFAHNMNGTEAVIQAGYQVSDRNTAASIASENLRKPKIRALVDMRLREMAMPANEVLTRLSEHARSDLGKYINVDEDGDLFIDLDRIKDDGLSHLIKKISQSRHGITVEFYDAQSALVQIGRAHGLFKDNVDLTSGGERLPQAQVNIYIPDNGRDSDKLGDQAAAGAADSVPGNTG